MLIQKGLTMSLKGIGLAALVLVLSGVRSDVARAVNPPSAPGTANPAPTTPAVVDIDNNPYVQLYVLRVAEAQSNLHRQQALADLAASKLERGRKLIYQNAISQEEYDTLVSDAAVTRADIDLAAKKIDEANAYLKIITALVKRGVTIPLCTYEME